MKKTPKMLSVESHWNIPLETLLADMIREHGMAITAQQLDVSRSALYIWIAKLGLEVNHTQTVTSRQEHSRGVQGSYQQ